MNSASFIDKGPQVNWLEYGLGNYKTYTLIIPESTTDKIVVGVSETKTVFRYKIDEPTFYPSNLDYTVDDSAESEVSKRISGE
jgi:hypothetical protein